MTQSPRVILLGISLLWLTLTQCGSSNQQLNESIETTDSISQSSPTLVATARNWSNSFAEQNWRNQWNIRSGGAWGEENIEVVSDPTRQFQQVLRVRYPEGSASPSVSRKKDRPLGGAQFYATLNIAPTDALKLSYYVRFSDDFEFVKGGKLPGLFGGTETSGGNIPDGTNGFSTRLMWRRDGDGELYAYLPTSKNYGTSIGRGSWQFVPGLWHHIEQEVILNYPDEKDGKIRVWVDGKLVIDEDKLTFRTTDNLKIEGIFFSTFFGGGSTSWATPKDVHTDFADFSVSVIENTP
ncbi:MAG: polysaccharide lyase [Microcoleaceae cyanobacterium]